MIITHSHFRQSFIAEARLLSVSLVPGGSFNQQTQSYEYKSETKAEHDAFANSETLKGGKEVFDAFAESDKIVSDDIFAYIANQEAGGVELSPYEQEIKKHVDTLTIDPAAQPTEQVTLAEKEINNLVSYINSRNEFIKKQRAELKNFQVNTDETPGFTATTINLAKGTIGKFAESFQRANLTEKGVILGGALSAFLIARFLYLKFAGGGTLKKILGVTLGVALTASAAETIWKGARKVSQNNDEWNAEKHAKEIEQIRTALKDQDISEEFLTNIEGKSVAPIANISTMDMDEFRTMYENARATKSIDEGDTLYPTRPVRKDGLLPSERYAIVEDIAKTVGIADENGELKELPPELEGKSMMYMMLNWNAPKPPVK